MNDWRALQPEELRKKILSLEGSALLRLAEESSPAFEKAVKLLSEIPQSGRLVVSGIGKAGFIGMKISATFASTGMPSFFLHPAEAVHGDLGRFRDEDAVLILSNSGETAEVIQILPFVKRRGCKVIAITSQPESSLAQHAEVVLSIGDHTEAGPLGLAPTTSTTLMLGLGDALAMAVLAQRDFSTEEFAHFHPAGRLGRSLMLVSDLMRSGDQMCVVKEEASCRETLHAITATKGRPGAALIVNERNELIGIFTDGDLRRCLDTSEKFLEQPVSEFMGKNPKTIRKDQLVQEALHLMSRFHIDQVAVVEDNRQPAGLIDIQDALAIKER